MDMYSYPMQTEENQILIVYNILFENPVVLVKFSRFMLNSKVRFFKISYHGVLFLFQEGNVY